MLVTGAAKAITGTEQSSAATMELVILFLIDCLLRVIVVSELSCAHIAIQIDFKTEQHSTAASFRLE
jgi:hypothetical protein